MAMTKIQKLVQEFEECVIAQTEALKNADHKTGNRFARRYIRAFSKLTKFGDEGRDALAALFSHPRQDVKVMAAVFLLRYRHVQATAILVEAARGVGLVAFGAQEALKRWEEGAWALDPS
jgi:hypothetical protein